MTEAKPAPDGRSNELFPSVHGLARSAVLVPIDLLQEADSPRLLGEDSAHIRVLAESDIELPPIIVKRDTMRVVDGMHRVRAALLRGDERISVLYFDGDDAAAFLLAVRSNVAHGLPLSLADRRAAAARIIDSFPDLSDRAIATISGLSPKTVAGLRPDPDPAVGAVVTRIGRDGRARPVNYMEGRRLARELLVNRPDTPLEEVARIAGVSRRTARDVRQRLNGRLPAVAEPTARPAAANSARRSQRDASEIIRNLRSDPSLRLSGSGRALIRLLDIHHAVWSQDALRLAESLPAHCVDMVADIAMACADTWHEFAGRLASRQRDLMSGPADLSEEPRDAS